MRLALSSGARHFELGLACRRLHNTTKSCPVSLRESLSLTFTVTLPVWRVCVRVKGLLNDVSIINSVDCV